MSDILCLEVDLVAKTGRPPLADKGPLAALSRAGRWAILKPEGLDLLRMTEEQKEIVRRERRVVLLPDAFTDFFGPPTEGKTMISITSFGYRNRRAPSDGAFVFDCRALRNPHYQADLRNLDGREKKVRDFVSLDAKFRDMFAKAKFHALTYANPTIAFGCVGGKHRSVALAEILAEELRGADYEVEVVHQELTHV